jgi:hypothetical protein
MSAHPDYVPAAEWASWEAEREQRNRDNDKAIRELQRRVNAARIPCLIDRVEDAENRTYLVTEAMLAALQLLAETRERLADTEQLLSDVIRERREPS